MYSKIAPNNKYLRNEFNSYSRYTSITLVWAVYALLIAKRFINKRKLFQPMLYEYNLGSFKKLT